MKTDFASAINGVNARQLLILFHECYKHGVEDASKVYDEEKRKTYVGVMKSSHIYWKVEQDYEIRWKEWMVELLLFCRNLSRSDTDVIRNYLYEVREYKGYKAVPLRVAMDFYVKGVEDFNAYPVYQGLEQFLAENGSYRWRKGFFQTVPMTYIDLFEDMHMIVYDRMHTDMGLISSKAKGHTTVFKTPAYDTFLTTINIGAMPDRTKMEKTIKR